MTDDYVRQLEDACLTIWQELPAEQVELLRQECPRLMDFLAHLHHSIDHEQAMVRVNVWAEESPFCWRCDADRHQPPHEEGHRG